MAARMTKDDILTVKDAKDYIHQMKFYAECDRPPDIDHVVVNGPATIVFFKDGTKTITKKMDCDEENLEFAVMVCIAKRAYGKNSGYNKKVKNAVANAFYQGVDKK